MGRCRGLRLLPGDGGSASAGRPRAAHRGIHAPRARSHSANAAALSVTPSDGGMTRCHRLTPAAYSRHAHGGSTERERREASMTLDEIDIANPDAYLGES